MLSPSAGHKKRLRGKKARARQRARYDFRSRYRQQDLPTDHVAVAVIEDPYSQPAYDADGNLDPAARLAPAQHPDGTVAEGQPGWVPPRRPTMTVIRALRDDPVGRMHSRRQIDEAQYSAARAFQQAADQATLGAVKSIDWTKTRVTGGLPPDPLTPSRQKAMKWLRVAEEAVARRYGLEGLGLTRAVLCDRQSVEQTARLRGATNDREIWFWGSLFRRCLNALAVAFGFSNSTRPPYRPPRLNGHAEMFEPALDPARQASESEIGDLRLRYGRSSFKRLRVGRANGGG